MPLAWHNGKQEDVCVASYLMGRYNKIKAGDKLWQGTREKRVSVAYHIMLRDINQSDDEEDYCRYLEIVK